LTTDKRCRKQKELAACRDCLFSGAIPAHQPGKSID
jgi:hypothetical protein